MTCYAYDGNGNLLRQETTPGETAENGGSGAAEGTGDFGDTPETEKPEDEAGTKRPGTLTGAAVTVPLPAFQPEAAGTLTGSAVTPGTLTGSAITAAAVTYTYDSFNRLICCDNGSILAEYAYNAEDYRVGGPDSARKCYVR